MTSRKEEFLIKLIKNLLILCRTGWRIYGRTSAYSRSERNNALETSHPPSEGAMEALQPRGDYLGG